MIGKTIGKYRIIEKLGRGGMGTVYKAVDETLDREVAVKVLNPNLSDSDVMKRFRKEAMTLAKLHHPDIATIHEIYQSETDLLMVMELVKGETFDQLLQRTGPLPPERAAYLVAQVLGALDHAHRGGVVHRDLKPANVMITDRGGIKILDFGIAYVAGSEHMTSDGMMVGTPAYMAPERVTGREVDGRADIYSAGVLFFRLLTGQLPFKADTAVDMVHMLLEEMPTAAQAYRPDLPAWCQAILDRALAKAPADRFQTAESFRAALVAAISTTSNEETGLFSVGDLGTDLAAPSGAAASPSSASVPVPAPAAAPSSSARIPAPPLSATPAPSASPPIPQAVSPDRGQTPPVPFPVPPPVPQPAAASSASWPVASSQTPPPPSSGPSTSAALPVATAASSVSVPAPPTASMVQPPVPPTGTAPMPIAAPTAAAPNPMASGGTTLVMPRKQFAIAGIVLGVLAIGVVVLAVIVLRGPSKPADAPAAATDAPAVAAAPAAAKPPASAPVEIREPEIKAIPEPPATPPALPAASTPAPRRETPASAAPARAVDATPLRFEAKAVVADGDKRRERDATVVLADGKVTVMQDNERVLYSIPIASITGLTYSNSRQPLWNSPTGPAEAMKVESGAFGFLRGGRNWFGLRTADSLLVVRVDDDAVSRVIAGLQDRTGLTLERLIEPKD